MSYLKRRLTDRLKDPNFRQEWEDSELEYIIARNIVKLRKESNLTQQELAKVLDTHQSAISRIEQADQNVTIGNLKSIAKALDVNVMEMFIESDDPLKELETTK